MKKNYQQPTLNVFVLYTEDIITGSPISDVTNGIDPYIGDFY